MQRSRSESRATFSLSSAILAADCSSGVVGFLSANNVLDIEQRHAMRSSRFTSASGWHQAMPRLPLLVGIFSIRRGQELPIVLRRFRITAQVVEGSGPQKISP